MPLRLRVPHQDDKLDPSLEVRAVYLEEWVEGLPYANPLQVIRILFERTRALNRAPLRPATRFEALEVFLPTLVYLRDIQVRAAETGTGSTFERNRASTDGARQLASQLAYGYKLVLAHSVAQPVLFGGKRLHRLAAQRSMQMLAQVVVHAYHEYLPRLQHVWSELGQIHAYAVSEGLHEIPGKGFARDDVFSDSVARAYKRVALLAMADPYRLRGSQLWRLHEHLGAALDCVDLQPAVAMPTQQDAAAWGYLSAAEDAPPLRHSSLQPPAADAEQGEYWCFDPQPAAEALREQVSRLVAEDRGFVGRAAAIIARRPERRDTRVDTQGTVEVATGLSAVHHFLTAAPSVRGPAAGAQLVTEDDDADAIDIGVPDVQDRVPSLVPTYSTTQWHVIDRGAGGFGLERPEDLPNALLVGEIIALRDAADAPWTLAIVRWLSIAAPSAYRVGLEALGNRVRAIYLAGEATLSEPLVALPKAVLAPGRTGPGSMAMLGTRGTFQEGAVVYAHMDQQPQPLRLRQTRLLESLNGVELLACEAV